MKKTQLFLLLSALPFLANAQSECEYSKRGATLESNHMSVRINTDGTLFHQDGEGHFINPDFGPGSTGTIRKAGLWIGGFETGTGVLKLAASAVDSDDERSDFYPGPLNPEDGKTYPDMPCDFMNQVYSVTREDILKHMKDFEKDGVIDDPVPSIMQWPGNGNPYFLWGWGEFGLPDTEVGWAPFYDRNVDGVYDPRDGDFPSLGFSGGVPNEIFWTVFNDEGGGAHHEVSGGDALQVEVQLTAWTMDCPDNPWAEDLLFTEYKILNRGFSGLDSMQVGLWVDFDLGCPEDDYIGSMPDRGAFYAYNSDDMDGGSMGECENAAPSYGETTPVMSVQILDAFRSEFNGFNYFHIDNSFGAGKVGPEIDSEYYNYLTGSWRDGTPLTQGGTGYSPGSTAFTNFAFPDLPGDEQGWSMFEEGFPNAEVIALGRVRPYQWGAAKRGELRRGDGMKFIAVFGFRQHKNWNHIDIVDKVHNYELYNSNHLVSEFFAFSHISLCNCPATLDEFSQNGNEDDPTALPEFNLYPNPTTGKVFIEYTGDEVYEVAIYNVANQLVYFDTDIESTGEIQLDLSHLMEGMYFLRMTVDGTVFEERLVVY